jgi:hypothetical protein
VRGAAGGAAARGLARALVAAGIALACASDRAHGPGAADAPAAGADDLLVVDCLLPGQIRQLGTRLTFATPRRAVRTTAVECRVRGGEYTAAGRASLATALAVWVPLARAGDPQAQNQVGELYERGLGLAPDPAAAAEWYRRAAEQGFAPAQINLGQLYELGLGVPRDPALALVWYRRASGLGEAGLDYVPDAPAGGAAPPGGALAPREPGARRSEPPRADAREPGPGAPSPPRPGPGIDFGAYHALVIGNDAYRQLPRLETAVADARAVASLLERRYGFRVTRLEDASRYQILSALNELRARLGAGDNLLVYYAGHGELDRVNMRGHWLPVDAEPASTANWISNISVTDLLNAMAAKQVLVVADSCYSGALTRAALARLEADLPEAARRSWLAAMAGRRARLAFTSGGLEPVFDRGGGGHSIFARALLDVLEANREVLEGQRLYREVAARVSSAAARERLEQVPEYAPLKYAGHEAGDFFFVPRG